VAFADGGETDVSCMCTGKEFKYGGRTMKDFEIVRSIQRGYGSMEKIKIGMEIEDREHGDTFRMLRNGEINYEQFLKKLVVDHLVKDPDYYANEIAEKNAGNY